jgi:hypothetical protein
MATVNHTASESWLARENETWQPTSFVRAENWAVADHANLFKGFDENPAAFDVRTITAVYDVRTIDSED